MFQNIYISEKEKSDKLAKKPDITLKNTRDLEEEKNEKISNCNGFICR